MCATGWLIGPSRQRGGGLVGMPDRTGGLTGVPAGNPSTAVRRSPSSRPKSRPFGAVGLETRLRAQPLAREAMARSAGDGTFKFLFRFQIVTRSGTPQLLISISSVLFQKSSSFRLYFRLRFLGAGGSFAGVGRFFSKALTIWPTRRWRTTSAPPKRTMRCPLSPLGSPRSAPGRSRRGWGGRSASRLR